MVEATAPEQAVCLARLPWLHSTLLPGTMRELQQGQTEANLAVMIMGDSVVAGGGLSGAFPLPTSINLTHGPWASSG
jgi:hypothetical protein